MSVTKGDFIIRKATEEEQKNMNPWIRWGYDRGSLMALWHESRLITLSPENPDPAYVTLLRKDAE